MQLTIKGRLWLLAGLAVAAVALLSALFFKANRTNEAALQALYSEANVTQQQLQRIDVLLLELRFRAAAVLLDQLPVQGSLNHLREARQELDGAWAIVQPLLQNAWGAGQEPAHASVQALSQHWQVVHATLQRLEQGYQSKDEDALTDVLESDWAALIQGVVKPLQQLIPLTQERAQATYDQARSASARMLALGVAGGGLCLLVLVAVAIWTMRAILQPLAGVQRALRLVADGDLAAVVVPPRRRDELGPMVDALRDMRQKLTQLVSQVRDAAQNIGLASVEVAQGHADLSERTEQTASSLQQTAASMEELAGSVGQSAGTAQQVRQQVGDTADVAQRGGQVVEQVVQTMQDITEASRRIADIISVIDAIAFQTNILALNAAVEAARAGEQGRGFAVVAGEVRSLAQRSAEAAKEIKSLITTSVDNVEAGSNQVEQAGQSMSEIVTSVRRVSDLIGEITASSTEQRDGIGQVNQAVANLDQMTQQNAALVEEASAAAASMREQAQRLAQVVSVFNVGGAASSRAVQQLPQAAQAHTAATPKAVSAPAYKPAAAKPAVKAAPAAPRIAAPKAAPATAAAAGADDDWESF